MLLQKGHLALLGGDGIIGTLAKSVFLHIFLIKVVVFDFRATVLAAGFQGCSNYSVTPESFHC